MKAKEYKAERLKTRKGESFLVTIGQEKTLIIKSERVYFTILGLLKESGYQTFHKRELT